MDRDRDKGHTVSTTAAAITTAAVSSAVATIAESTIAITATLVVVVAAATMEATVVTGSGAVRGFVDTNDATIESGRSAWSQEERKEGCYILLVVHGGHGSISIVLHREADETKAAATVGVTILDDNLDD